MDPALNNNAGEFRCAIPGRLIPRKGHLLVLKHCTELREKIDGFKLVIIGDGEQRKELESYVEENDLNDCVSFTGNVGDVRPHLAQADLILIPSYAEGLPLVIFEAMSVSKPVIAFDTIGPAEVVENGVTGYLIKPFDDRLFSEKIIELSKDSQALLNLGRQASIQVERKFSLDVMTKKTMQFYQTCLN
jgi:glycosyltransferase involved in cell wall biosynthesis